MTHRELSVRDIIDRFSGKDVCLMKHALIAKAEEDKVNKRKRDRTCMSITNIDILM